MTIAALRRLAGGVVVLGALSGGRSLHAQIGIGTWVKKATESAPAMTMTVEACCDGGRRLTYKVDMGGTQIVLTLASKFDGSEAPVMIDGKPTAETMAIKRVDDHHLTNILKMNGKKFGTSTSTLSADGKTLTVVSDFTSAVAGNAVGKTTEIWVRK